MSAATSTLAARFVPADVRGTLRSVGALVWRYQGWLPLAVYGWWALTMWRSVTANAANILMSDQWGIYPSFAPLNPVQVFYLQQGPHRFGLGGLLTWIVVQFGNWDSRIEGLLTAAVLILAAGLALWLKTRVIGPLVATDVVIPVLILTPAQYEWLVIAPYPAAAVVPLALLLGYLLVLTVREPRVRLPAALALGVTSAYTGYGIVLAPLFPLALVASTLWRRGELRTSVVVAGLMAALEASVLIHFEPTSGTGCSGVESWSDWAKYAAAMQANPFGFRFGDNWNFVFLGAAVATTLVLSSLALAPRLASHPAFVPLATLGAASLIDGVATATGRVCLGTNAATSSRYITLMLPSILAFYCALHLIPWRDVRRVLLAEGTLAILLMTYFAGVSANEQGRTLGLLKVAFTECYLQRAELEPCDKWVGFPFSRWMGNADQFRELRERHLSLYGDAYLQEPRLVPENFDPDRYLAANPDVAKISMNAVHHYVTYGKNEGRKLAPD